MENNRFKCRVLAAPTALAPPHLGQPVGWPGPRGRSALAHRLGVLAGGLRRLFLRSGEGVGVVLLATRGLKAEQLDQIFRDLDDLLFNMLPDVQPFRRPQAGRNRLAQVRADIIRNPIGLMNRDVKLVARGI